MRYNWPFALVTLVALGVDVLAPEGYGEVIGGGERATSHGTTRGR
jgi:aspartyl/asparaginyl-tRNA synthetase